MLELLLAYPRIDPLAVDKDGKDALEEALTSWRANSKGPAALRLLHQPCVLRSRLRALPWGGELAKLRVSAADLCSLAWDRRALVVAAHPQCRELAGVPPL